MPKKREPIKILKLIVMTNGEQLSIQLERNPRMTDPDMMTILESVMEHIKEKHGKTK